MSSTFFKKGDIQKRNERVREVKRPGAAVTREVVYKVVVFTRNAEVQI